MTNLSCYDKTLIVDDNPAQTLSDYFSKIGSLSSNELPKTILNPLDFVKKCTQIFYSVLFLKLRFENSF